MNNSSDNFAGLIGRRKMPSVSLKQQKMMGADLARKRVGKKTLTGMSEAQLRDFAKKVPIQRKGSARKK
jgi:hypothetical protein